MEWHWFKTTMLKIFQKQNKVLSEQSSKRDRWRRKHKIKDVLLHCSLVPIFEAFLVPAANFDLIQVDYLCKSPLITVKFKFSIEKDTILALRGTKRKIYECGWLFSTAPMTKNEELVLNTV